MNARSLDHQRKQSTHGMTTLLARFLDELPDVLAAELLPKLDSVDLALLSRVNHAAREAVKDSGLSRMGGSADGPRATVDRFCGGSLSLFVWGVSKMGNNLWEKTTTCSAAAAAGNVKVLVCEDAAYGGELEALQWLREHECP
jgi:hypothetical protein